MIDRDTALAIRLGVKARVENLLKSMAVDQLDYSLVEGAVYRDFCALVPYCRWESAPNPSYSHWALFGLSEGHVSHPALTAVGVVDVERRIDDGLVLLVRPRSELQLNVASQFDVADAFMRELRSHGEDRVHRQYWSAVQVFADPARSAERIPRFRALLEEMRQLAELER